MFHLYHVTEALLFQSSKGREEAESGVQAEWRQHVRTNHECAVPTWSLGFTQTYAFKIDEEYLFWKAHVAQECTGEDEHQWM